MTNRTQNICIALGWQGGTIHQVAEATGCSAQELLYHEVKNKAGLNNSHSSGWFAARTCSLDFNRSVNFPKHHGDVEFWIGVADGLAVNSGESEDEMERARR